MEDCVAEGWEAGQCVAGFWLLTSDDLHCFILTKGDTCCHLEVQGLVSRLVGVEQAVVLSPGPASPRPTEPRPLKMSPNVCL